MLFGKKNKGRPAAGELGRASVAQSDVVLQVKMDRATLDQLDAYCESRGMTRSQAVCQAVQQLKAK